MAAPIEAAAREHIPEYVAGKTLKEMSLPEGQKLRNMCDNLRLLPLDPAHPKLNASQRLTQTILGKVRWYDKVCPATARALHALSCVASRPPPEALIVAKAVLACQYDLRNVGITYGGGGLSSHARLTGSLYAEFVMSDGASTELEATADSTWCGTQDDVYALLITYYGAAVAHVTKKMHLIIDSSMESEAVATGKCGEAITYAREILRALGVPPNGPSFIGTDNKANGLIASGRSLSTKSRHALRRYTAFLQRVKRGDVEVGHVPDEENPADFMTKWVPRAKHEASIEFATNSRNRVRASPITKPDVQAAYTASHRE